MEGISINGVKLSLDVDVDDTGIQEKVDEMVSAVNTLNNGSNELNDGTKELYDATGLLKEKTTELYSTVGQLKDGTNDLYSGLSDITKKNQELINGAYSAFEGICKASSMMLNSELAKNGLPEVTLMPENYSEVLEGLLMQLNANAVPQELYGIVAANVTAIKEELDNYSLFYEGLKAYTASVGEAVEGAKVLNSNVSLLYENTGILDGSVKTLKDAVKKLYDGTSELKEGTGEFADKTADISNQVSDTVDSLISSLSGSDVEVVSFVSEKNTKVKSVQFVMKTASIEKVEVVEEVVEEKESKNLWEKFISLFQ
ncbi:MAG: hypothetical protein IJA32_14655 [Lachnospiraceae bacterium]|nr:hypothetical protein [Lachnospiraceae bacterium]